MAGSRNAKKPIAVWALLATCMSLVLGIRTIAGLPSCSDYARAADVKEIDRRIENLVTVTQALQVTAAEHTIQIKHLSETERSCK